jgi:hypothetical protein
MARRCVRTGVAVVVVTAPVQHSIEVVDRCKFVPTPSHIDAYLERLKTLNISDANLGLRPKHRISSRVAVRIKYMVLSSLTQPHGGKAHYWGNSCFQSVFRSPPQCASANQPSVPAYAITAAARVMIVTATHICITGLPRTPRHSPLIKPSPCALRICNAK